MDNPSVAREAAGVVCFECGAPRERAIGADLPGHTTFAPCGACGAIGIQREADLYQAPQHKKATRLCYWERAS